MKRKKKKSSSRSLEQVSKEGGHKGVIGEPEERLCKKKHLGGKKKKRSDSGRTDLRTPFVGGRERGKYYEQVVMRPRAHGD